MGLCLFSYKSYVNRIFEWVNKSIQVRRTQGRLMLKVCERKGLDPVLHISTVSPVLHISTVSPVLYLVSKHSKSEDRVHGICHLSSVNSRFL